MLEHMCIAEDMDQQKGTQFTDYYSRCVAYKFCTYFMAFARASEAFSFGDTPSAMSLERKRAFLKPSRV